MKEHSRYKDSENYDFADGKWKKTSYKNNSRIKKAKNDCISYVKRYIKTPQGGFIYE